MNKKSKKVAESPIQMRMLVMPNHTNPRNTIFGGVVMGWIDMAAAMCAEKHSEKICVTVHIDDISFKAPIKIGDHVCVSASINYVGKSSMVIGCKVIAENPLTKDVRHTTSAYLTFVALDDVGRPTSVPSLELVTDDEKRRFTEAKERIRLKAENASKFKNTKA
jgi:acyl-CoA hydrolase